MKDIISKRRRELGLTQQQLAKKLNVSDKVVSKWETGKSLPDTSMLIPLAEALQISVCELMGGYDTDDRKPECPDRADSSGTVSRDIAAEIDKTAAYEANVSYKNSCIVTMAMQLAAAILISAGRVLWDKSVRYGADLSEFFVYILFMLGAFFEISAVAFFLIKRNNLLVKYPTHTDCDKKYINILSVCTYPLVLAVIVVFVALHGLSTLEQLIVLLLSATIALLPFAALLIWNRKRKN